MGHSNCNRNLLLPWPVCFLSIFTVYFFCHWCGIFGWHKTYTQMLNDKVDWRDNDKCMVGGTKASFWNISGRPSQKNCLRLHLLWNSSLWLDYFLTKLVAWYYCLWNWNNLTFTPFPFLFYLSLRQGVRCWRLYLPFLACKYASYFVYYSSIQRNLPGWQMSLCKIVFKRNCLLLII